MQEQAAIAGQTLLIDADDTLWENNVYFERAIASFLTEFDHMPHTREQVREHLDRCEHENIRRMGYGLLSFEASLVQCFTELSETPVTNAISRKFREFAHSIATQEMELLPDVKETLEYLRERHELVLVTKGVDSEQRDKLERSGLARFFSAVEVWEEKSAERYARQVEELGAKSATTWMIGNSPKSDVHEALSAGLNAVHIPHPLTWVLEECEVCAPHEGRRMIALPRFSDLALHF